MNIKLKSLFFSLLLSVPGQLAVAGQFDTDFFPLNISNQETHVLTLCGFRLTPALLRNQVEGDRYEIEFDNVTSNILNHSGFDLSDEYMQTPLLKKSLNVAYQQYQACNTNWFRFQGLSDRVLGVDAIRLTPAHQVTVRARKYIFTTLEKTYHINDRGLFRVGQNQIPAEIKWISKEGWMILQCENSWLNLSTVERLTKRYEREVVGPILLGDSSGEMRAAYKKYEQVFGRSKALYAFAGLVKSAGGLSSRGGENIMDLTTFLGMNLEENCPNHEGWFIANAGELVNTELHSQSDGFRGSNVAAWTEQYQDFVVDTK